MMILHTGRYLKAALALAGLSQNELAKAAGVHFNSVKFHEAKPGHLGGWAVNRMADALAACRVEADDAGIRLTVLTDD
jgi:transcriptional regulator with XRE-family HTH domain